MRQTYSELPHDIIDDVILVDDSSNDNTTQLAADLGIQEIIVHERNLGYGANQKTCYAKALKKEADIIIMIHPDYQYSPKLVRAMVSLIAENIYDVVLGSRIIGGGAIKGGMPVYKYFFNRVLTLIQNIIIGQKLSEFHTGLRAYHKRIFSKIILVHNSNDFVFDNELLVQAHFHEFKIGEISCPTKYFPDASSINFLRSLVYGIGCLLTSFKYVLHKRNIYKFKIFSKNEDAPL